MALGSALSTARNSLKTSSGQINIVSQNIAGARDPNYTRRTTHVQSGPNGTVSAIVRRDDNPQLLNNYISKSSQAYAASALSNGANRLSGIYSANDYSNSPSRLLSDFQKSLQLYANAPGQRSTGDAAVDKAKNLVDSLNNGSKEIEKLRNDADSDIKDSVDHINDLLKQFQKVDETIANETALGRDAFDYMDQRDSILKELSQEIGITTVQHSDGTTTIYGMDGSTLYDKTPRKITFEPSSSLPAGKTGNQVFIDGVPLGHSSFSEPYGSGNIGGLLKVRDEIAPQYQKQLDEMASALVDMFDGTPALFENGGDNSVTGMAGRISLNPIFDSKTPGGGPEHFGKDIQKLVDKFDQSRVFGSDTGLEANQSIMGFAKQSQSWMEGTRSTALNSAQYQSTMYSRAAEALSNDTGVNTDDEMALMLQLEQSYSASARVISTVGKMLDDLMNAIH